MKTKRHAVTVYVVFDKPTTIRAAIAAVRDCVYGTFYPTAYREADPEQFKITSVRTAEKRR